MVTWRLLSEGTPLLGAVAGVVGTLLTYLGALALLGGFLLAAAVLSPPVAVPIGCLGGLIYERIGVAT